jgi:hypothetical protein
MIRITPVSEPAEFDDRVRVPGQRFLASVLAGAKVDFTNREYWRRVLLDLHHLYDGICAYTCHWIPFDTGNDTVEHFIPKSTDPQLAYEWLNYRLVCGRLNGRKGVFQDVVDPFKVTKGMFYLHFPSLCVIAGKSQKTLADGTIERLQLNDNRCISMRQRYVEDYVDGEITLSFVRSNAPFLAFELARQGLSRSKLGIVLGRH